MPTAYSPIDSPDLSLLITPLPAHYRTTARPHKSPGGLVIFVK